MILITADASYSCRNQIYKHEEGKKKSIRLLHLFLFILFWQRFKYSIFILFLFRLEFPFVLISLHIWIFFPIKMHPHLSLWTGL